MVYKTHFTETCDADSAHHITHVETTGAVVQDVQLPEKIHAKLATNQLLDQERIPAGGFKSSRLRTSINQVTQSFLLALGQLGLASAAMVIRQALLAQIQPFVDPDIETWNTEAPALTEFHNGSMLNKMLKQCANATHLTYIASIIGTAQTFLDGVDSLAPQVNSRIHGCILLQEIVET